MARHVTAAAVFAVLLATFWQAGIGLCGKLPVWQQRAAAAPARRMAHTTPAGTLRAASTGAIPTTKSKLKLLTSMISTCSTARGVLSVLRGETPSECNDIVISAAIYRLAYTKATFTRNLAEDKAFLVLLKCARRLLQTSSMGQRELSNVYWAIATARTEIPEFQLLTPFVIHETLRNCSGMDPQETSNMLWAIATLWKRTPDNREVLKMQELMPKITEHVAVVCDRFQFQALANVIFAIALIRDGVPEAAVMLPTVMKALTSRFERPDKLQQDEDETYTLEGKAMMAMALAAVECNDNYIINAVAEGFEEPPTYHDLSKPLLLINLLCAFANLGIRNKRLLDEVAGAPWGWTGFSDHNVAAVVWAFDESDLDGSYTRFRRKARAEASRRGLTETQIKHSRLGYMLWED